MLWVGVARRHHGREQLQALPLEVGPAVGMLREQKVTTRRTDIEVSFA
ncbi:hypothetical protein [Streptomyces sp. NPDC046197]